MDSSRYFSISATISGILSNASAASLCITLVFTSLAKEDSTMAKTERLKTTFLHIPSSIIFSDLDHDEALYAICFYILYPVNIRFNTSNQRLFTNDL